MRRVLLVLLSPVAAAACQATPEPVEASDAVAAISLQGASHARTRVLLSRGSMPTLERLAREGTGLGRLIPADAPATATARATFETGATPEAHGIVGNTFHVRGDSIRRLRSGFATPLGTETLVQAAVRQGISVATVGIPPRDGTVPDAAVTSGRVVQPARLITLTRDAPVHTAAIMVGADTVAFVVERSETGVTAQGVTLDPGAWTPFWLRDDRGTGLWLKLLRFDVDGAATIYAGPVVETVIEPAPLRTFMEDAWGPAPSTPDYDHHAIGAIDDATWREQVLRETEYLVTAAERIAQVSPVRLLMVGINLLDAHEHQFLRSDPRHPVHGRATPAEQTRFRDLIEDAYRIADDAVRRIAAHVPSTVAASEYALLPVHSRVQLAFALAQHGVRVSGDDADVRVIASSASAHIRLNVRGREPTGVVQDSTALRERLVDVLRGLADPRTGEPLLARITTPSTGAPGTGDIHVIAAPGYALAHDPDATALIDTPFLPGEHAFDPALAETHGIFIAAGPLFPARSDSLSLHAADVAVSVAGMLGIDPPIGATGHSILR